jgi:hypothetical protein
MRTRSLSKIMKINVHEMLLCRPILLIVLKTGLYVRVCFFLGHPKILQIRVSWFPGGMGGDQIGCHKVSDMIAPPGTMLTPSLSRNTPAISSLTKSMAAGARPPALWSNVGGVGWTLACSLPPPVMWCIATCPIRFIGLIVPFRPFRWGRKAFLGSGS